MHLPPDWDVPSKGNGLLCDKFEKHVFTGGPVALPYRLFLPKPARKVPLPLVIYLHGADAVGHDNESPLSMHDIGTMFARDDWQNTHPCYILAPQYNYGQHWSMSDTQEAFFALLDQLKREHWGIDRSRIYIYGYSAGGVGTLRYVKERPYLFAAAISICGATGREDIEELYRTPLYMVHAADDEIVKASYLTPKTLRLAHFGSRDIYAYLMDKDEEACGQLHYKELPEGWMKEHYGVNAHCSWVAVSDAGDGSLREWMFARTRLRLHHE